MFTVSRKILILLLVLLNAFAPLIHAHTGDNSAGFGLHVPGLESYKAIYDSNSDSTSFLQSKTIYNHSNEGLIVGVTTAIMSNHQAVLKSGSEINFCPDNWLLLPQPALSTELVATAIYLLFALFLFISGTFVRFIHSPRAPPEFSRIS
jgi:hypothetical protein